MNGQTEPKRHGCLFYGCIVSCIAVLVLAVGGFFTIRYAIKSVITQFTDAAPQKLPKPQLSPAELQIAKERIAAFRDGLKAGRTGTILELKGEEINALFAGGPASLPLQDWVYANVEGDQIKGQISLPLDRLRMPLVKGRYLNGTAVFKVSLANGILDVRADSIEVKGKPLPKSLMSAFRKRNLAEHTARDAQAAEVLQKLQSIEVKDGTITIKGK